ncbi:MAG: TIGR00730 family Rossman fold protein [Candidatus Saccharimonadales bacterium]
MNNTDDKAKIPKREIIQNELLTETSERLSRIDKEFADGFDIMNRYNDTVTIFGSARFDESSPYYQKAREVATALSNEGYTIVTGGGSGIMEAGNRGAFEANGNSVGFNIKLPKEQSLNPYTTESKPFRYFFSRKVILAYGASAYIYFPGGFGTMDELFEIMTLIQTKKMPAAPIILVGGEYWMHLDYFIKSQLLKGAQTISPGDEDLYTITEDIEVIKAVVNEHRDKVSPLGNTKPDKED